MLLENASRILQLTVFIIFIKLDVICSHPPTHVPPNQKTNKQTKSKIIIKKTVRFNY